MDATFDYITKHDLNHSLFLFWIITNPFIELFSSLGNGKYELFSKGAISEINFAILNETLNPNLNVSSLQLLQKDHCTVSSSSSIVTWKNTSLYQSSHGSTNSVSPRTFSAFFKIYF